MPSVPPPPTKSLLVLPVFGGVDREIFSQRMKKMPRQTAVCTNFAIPPSKMGKYPPKIIYFIQFEWEMKTKID